MSKEKSASNAHWWQTFFDDSYGRMGLDVIETERTQKEVDFIISALELEKQERILDLCCGMGRHALELARRGFTGVTGLDYTQEYLDKAQTFKLDEGLNVRFIQGDMRFIPFEQEFDACYNYFTSFGFFEKDAENEKVIACVSKTLMPGGRFLIELMHRDFTIRRFHARSWMDYDGGLVLKAHEIDLAESRVIGKWTFVKDGKVSSSDMRLRMYSLHEMIAMLERNGLRFVETWGNTMKEPLTWDNPRMIVLAKKK
ncbi:class I SAM-dependent methyltransferase [candidate division WOR-3 bacterium]|nr:class I SAM-dependent methyltransferase [candidate division WOR-3 bacterium]